MADLYPGEVEPIATDPILRGVDLALDRLVRRDCFTERTVRILDELRAEVIAHSGATYLCQRLSPEVGHEDDGYSCSTHNMPWGECPEPGGSEPGGAS